MVKTRKEFWSHLDDLKKLGFGDMEVTDKGPFYGFVESADLFLKVKQQNWCGLSHTLIHRFKNYPDKKVLEKVKRKYAKWVKQWEKKQN